VEPGAHLNKHNILVDCGVALELVLEAPFFVDEFFLTMNLNRHDFQRKPVPVVFLTIMCNVSHRVDLIFKIPKGTWSWRKRIQGKAERALSGGTLRLRLDIRRGGQYRYSDV
jgi:hypothetical protein